MSKQPRISKAALRQFPGTENWYRRGLNRAVLFTDGAKYVADICGAYWLLDEIALLQCFEPRVAGEKFQVWTLTVNPAHTAALVCEDGNSRKVFSKVIEFTDFPIDAFSLWYANNTILLPSEY